MINKKTFVYPLINKLHRQSHGGIFIQKYMENYYYYYFLGIQLPAEGADKHVSNVTKKYRIINSLRM